MSKGPEQTGTQTVTTQDPRAQFQQPFLQSGIESASDIWRNEQTNPQGYNDYFTQAQPGGPVSQVANAAAAPFYAGTSGQYSGANSPSYGGYQDVSTGNTYGQQLAGSGATAGYGLAGTAAPTGQRYADLLSGTAAGTNAALADPMAQLKQQSSSYYLNSNPYLDQMYNTAADAVTSQYKTATAPRTDSSYELAGRYGSGVAGNATSQNEQNLGRSLSGLAGDIYGKNYAAERALQNQATGTYGNLAASGQQLQQTGYNQAGNQALSGINYGQSGYSSAGNLGLSGTQAQTSGLAGLQGGYNTGNAAAMQAAGLLPTLQQGYYAGPQGEVSSIAGLQQQQWDPLTQYMKIITQPPGYQMQTTQQPIYGSSAGQTLGTVASTAAKLAPLFIGSDRRIKEDTRIVGHIGRLPVHTFRYQGEAPGTRRIGFMADEVEKIDSGAVATTNLGFKAVDYGRAAASALE